MVFLCLAADASADIKITTKNSFSGHQTQGTTYIKGARQRTDQAPGLVSIYQCDQKRIVQLNDSTRTYLIVPLTDDAAPAAQPATPAARADSASRKGGIVTFTVNITDTGERKQMFGFTARHIKTSMTQESTPDACDKSKSRIDTDGWYIDLEYGLNCSANKPFVPQRYDRQNPGCVDEYRFKNNGSARLGYPLTLTTVIKEAEGERAFTTTTEVVELSTTNLDAALFEIPAGYQEAKNIQELYGVPAGASGVGASVLGERGNFNADDDDSSGSRATEAKLPGTIRIGVVAINNRSDRSLSFEALRQHLISSIAGDGVDAVPLNARAQADIEAEAKEKECDFILYTDLAEFKKPSAGSRLSGALGGRVGLGGAIKEKYEAKLEYRLFALGSASAKLNANVSAKEEGSEEAPVLTALERKAKAVVDAVRKKK